jgi:hypothetical protein
VQGGQALVSSTLKQIETIKSTFKKIPTSPELASLIQSDNALLKELHTELQKNTRFFKSDMSSLLGIAITFASGDGD